MRKKLSIRDLHDLRGQRQLTEVFVSTAEEAAACEEAGIDMLVTRAAWAADIRRASPTAFLTVALPVHGSVSDAEAIRLGLENMALGADAVYTGAGLERVRAMAREHIPVVGHVGLVPYRASWYGGLRPVGKTAGEALQVYRETLAYQEAGAIGVEMELVPREVAAEIARRVSLLVISMGSGSGGGAQYLFACDILGTERGHVPRHAKVYRDLASEYDRLQRERVAAFQEYKADVDSGAFPEGRHSIGIAEGELESFLRGIEDTR
jgi:3-methyl-2-oxobutanoate hydroxymethyltransferase